jgi:hypothetical protein
MTNPKILSQIGVLGRICIYEAGQIQIELHLFQWIEDELKFIWYDF